CASWWTGRFARSPSTRNGWPAATAARCSTPSTTTSAARSPEAWNCSGRHSPTGTAAVAPTRPVPLPPPPGTELPRGRKGSTDVLFLYVVLLLSCSVLLVAGVLEQRRHYA